ncbi:MAG: arsenate reductase ArsC, partial [Actinobacteria bacterium]|nr:arsenate reductase ArsC [Actinomycetota bacterium]
LFVCVENACRSQMAEGLFNCLKTDVKAKSAGTVPAGSIDPVAVEVMEEKGIDISKQIPKKLSNDLVDWADTVITMGCIDNCPYTPPDKTIEWNIPDPRGKDKQEFIKVRDIIEKKLLILLKKES